MLLRGAFGVGAIFGIGMLGWVGGGCGSAGQPGKGDGPACVRDLDCKAPTEPVCDSDACRGCATDGECAARDPQAPLCAVDGVCGACRTDDDCTTPGLGVCDRGARTCRACLTDGDCASGVCETGACASPGEVVHVDDDAICGQGDGSAERPACSIGEGLALYAQAARPYLLVHAGSYVFPALNQAALPVIVGAGASIHALSPTDHCVDLTGSAALHLRGFQFGGCATAVRIAPGTQSATISEITVDGGATGVDCNAKTCTIAGVTTKNTGIGIRCGSGAICTIFAPTLVGGSLGILGQSAQLVVNGGTVSGAALLGVDLGECEAQLTGLLVEDAGFGISQGLTAGVSCIGSFCELTRVRVQRSAGPGLYLSQSSYDVRASVFMDNGRATVPLAYGGGVVIDAPGSTKRFEGNTVIGNRAATGASAGLSCGGGAAIVGSIVWGNQGGAPLGATCVASYSVVDAAAGGTGNLNVDPMLDGYHLSKASPCRDASDPAMTQGQDVDGDPRAQNGRADIGADELAP
jgi:hypothetical protein